MAAPLINQILDLAPNAVVSMDESGRVTYWNPRAEEMFGVSREDALGKRVAELIIPERFRAAHAAAVDRFLADGTGPLIGRKVELEALRSFPRVAVILATLAALAAALRWRSATNTESGPRLEDEPANQAVTLELWDVRTSSTTPR